jgi:glycosyltransferase involved in cell wall biosynthesis
MTRAAVVYTCHDAFPSADANTQQIFRTVLEVARLGVDVELTIPALADGAERSAAGGGRLAGYYGVAAADVPESFRVRPIGTHAPKGQLARGWFDLRTPGYLDGRVFDLAWTRDPVAAAALSRRGRPVVFETFRPDFATRAKFAVWRLALFGGRGLHGVITHSHTAAAAFVAAGIPRERCLVAHNGFEPALMAPDLTRAQARAQAGWPVDSKIVMFAGHPGRDKGTALMLDIAEEIREATVVVLGADAASPEGRWLAGEAQRRGIGERFLLRPFVRPAAVAPYLYAADCLVVPPYARGDERHRARLLPIKVFTYLAAGRAIVAPRLPDIEEVLIDDQTARLYDPARPDDAVNAVKALLADERLRTRLAHDARRASAAFTWRARAERIVAFFESIGAGQPRSAMAAAASSR